MKPVNLHIIGVQKAGTTALASFLQQHPSVYVVEGKEAHIFDHPEYSAQAAPQDFARRQYQRRMQNYQGQPIICDATPITVYQPTFLRACYHYNPQAKFILILRDPVERAISHYLMSKRTGQESRNMLSAFVLEPLRLAIAARRNGWAFNSPLRTQSYLHRGLYRKQLQFLYNLIPATQVLVLRQQELKHAHQQTLLKIFSFLDIHRHPIAPETVFAAPESPPGWLDRLARRYARLYFRLRGESDIHWLPPGS
ncbi:sulfotransferase family protein [Bowmanella denitrificans]|uniref:sulfotransferase family protein n=1 Tax=Bowmanella denitrificans TaxID=366582 RepID=UPI000C9CFA31|nr:sulfotransferase [Bowmanella denitrificans]